MIRFSKARAGVSGLALAAVLALAGPALANDAAAAAAPVVAAAPVSPEGDRLGAHIVSTVFDHAGEFKPLWDMGVAIGTAQMKAAAEKSGGFSLVAYDRFSPWYGYFMDASAEEFRDDRGRYQQILGHWLAEKYTVEELQALSDLCDSPAGQEFYTQLAAAIPALASKSAPKFTWSKEAQAAMDHFKSSPGGKAFMARTEEMGKDVGGTAAKMMSKSAPGAEDKKKDAMDAFSKDPQTTSMIMDLVATWMPGTMRRWGEKAEAAEKARVAAIAAGAPPPPASH